MPPAISQVFPRHIGSISIREAYAVGRYHERATELHRPWVSVCMVASLDGSVTLEGSSGRLGNPNDLQVLITMRQIADVVIVGAGTAKGEGYGPPKEQGKRIGVVTNRGSIDPSSELFRSGAGFAIAPRHAPIPEGVECLRAGEDVVDLDDAIRRMHEIIPGVAHIQAEGGPSLNASLLEADLIDELDLTMAPTLVGGDGPRLTSGTTEIERALRLGHLLVDDDGYIFSRWVRR